MSCGGVRPSGLVDFNARSANLARLGDAGVSAPLLAAKSRHLKLDALWIQVTSGAAAMSDLTTLLDSRPASYRLWLTSSSDRGQRPLAEGRA